MSGNGWRSSIAALLGIAAVAAVAHAPSLGYGYTWLDDDKLVLSAQPFLAQPGASLRAFGEEVMRKTGGGGFYRPMLTLSLIPAAKLTGRAPFPHHLTNLLLHVAASFLVFLVLSRMLRRTGWPLAFACAYAAHPALAQAVAWVPGRNDSLLAVFALSSFLAFLRTREGGRAGALAAHAALWLCALLTKETAVVLPLLCLAEIAIVEKAPLARAARPLLAVWVPAGVGWFALRTSVLGVRGLGPVGLAGDAIRDAPALLVAAGHALIPVGLSVYPTLGGVPWAGIAAAGIAAALVVSSRGDDRRRGVFGALWFVVWLAPTLAEPSLSGDRVVFDHRIATGLLGLGLVAPADRIAAWARRSPWSARAVAAAAVAVLALLTRRYEPRFFDARSFWRSAVEGSPRSAFARNGLGAALYRTGDLAGAEAAWRAAEDIDPRQRFVHENLGLLLLRDGRIEGAAREFESELAANPASYGARVHLGELRARAGDDAGAVRLWEEARALEPLEPEAYVLLLRHALAVGDGDAFAACAREAVLRRVPLPPDLAEAVRDGVGG